MDLKKLLELELKLKMELYKFHIYNYDNYPNFKEFIKNLMESYNNTIIVKIGLLNDNKSTYLFDRIINKYGGNFLVCDNCPNRINGIRTIISEKSQIIIEDPIIFSINLKESLINYPNIKLNIFLDLYDLNITSIENANIYLNIYYMLKGFLNQGSQLLINNPKNTDFINIMEKEIINYKKKDIQDSQILYTF